MSENINDKKENNKKKYEFGTLQEFDLEKIEQEILKESVYLDVFAGSDIAFKENIVSLETGESAKILTLNAYKYNYKVAEYSTYNFPTTIQYGVMAQELEGLFPEMIKTDESGLKHVNYASLTGLLLQTVKGLEERIKVLEQK